jgi:hypothetical protein
MVLAQLMAQSRYKDKTIWKSKVLHTVYKSDISFCQKLQQKKKNVRSRMIIRILGPSTVLNQSTNQSSRLSSSSSNKFNLLISLHRLHLPISNKFIRRILPEGLPMTTGFQSE